MRHAFSLVELSIVLVILGLLTGGILAGQSLIRAAELRTLSGDYSKFQTAIHTFRDKYFALPGDMANATSFWGIAAGDGLTANSPCRDTATTDGRTCNGDGNGQIAASSSLYEMLRGWQHLSRAGLIEGNYVGAPSPGLLESGVTVPASRVATGGSWTMFYYVASVGNTTSYAQQAGHGLTIAGPATYYLKPEEMWNVDTKLDDGIPNRGVVHANKGTTTYPCSTTANQAIAADTNSQYNLVSSTTSCYAHFKF